MMISASPKPGPGPEMDQEKFKVPEYCGVNVTCPKSPAYGLGGDAVGFDMLPLPLEVALFVADAETLQVACTLL